MYEGAQSHLWSTLGREAGGRIRRLSPHKLKSFHATLAASSLLAMIGCSSMIPSLAPRLHDSAVAYDSAISDINDRVLLANIVRARDYVPLSITELSTITGTLSEQASLGLSVPFGGNYGSTPRGTATPSVQLGTAPTFSMAALNTRGFTLNIIQPISPVYVASKWNGGISHELLLLLFVKDIQFADSYERSVEDCAHKPSVPMNSDGLPIMPGNLKPLVACHHKFINDPDSPGEQQAFKAIVESMLPSVGIKVMTILDPVGPPFPFLPQVTTDGAGKKSEQNPLDAYALTTHLADGQYHVANKEEIPGRGQLYRVYSNQVAVCANDPIKTVDGTFYIYPVSADIAAARHAEASPAAAPRSAIAQDWEDRLETFKSQCATGVHPADHACHGVKTLTEKPKSIGATNSFASYSLIRSATGAGSAAGERAESPRAGSRVGSESSGYAMTEVGSSLQQNRVGAFLRADDCYADQTIREPATEGEFHKYTETLGHIEWRSIAEVFQYLGAVARQEKGVTWSVPLERDVVGSDAHLIADTMFVLRAADAAAAKQAKLRVAYGGENVAIGSGAIHVANEAFNDQSLLVLSLLSELVNSAKLSSDIPVTQQLQVLP
jgi:hypothetical protein